MRALERIDRVLEVFKDEKILRHFVDDHLENKPGDQLGLFDDRKALADSVFLGLKNSLNDVDFISYWKDSYDMRLGQAAINYGTTPNSFLWYVEENDWIAQHYPEHASSVLFWGTYGKNGDQPLKRVAIIDMSTDHLQACLDTQFQMNSRYKHCMELELKKRHEEKQDTKVH